MTAAETSQPGFSAEDSSTLDTYRPMSRLAVAALLLGVASATALVTPVLWVFPALTIVLAVAAFRQIKHDDVPLRGQALVAIGVILALLFGTWAAARTLSRQYVLVTQTREHIEEWFELLKERRFHEAHQLTFSFTDRLDDGASLEEAYAPPDLEAPSEFAPPSDDELLVDDYSSTGGDPFPLSEQFEVFFGQAPMDEIYAAEDLQVRYDRTSLIEQLTLDDAVIEQIYEVSFRKDGQQRTRRVRVVVARNCADEDVYWRIDRIAPEESKR